MKTDIAIIGGGIAGAGLAAELAGHASVVLIEAEETPGYHSTGRSAAFWHETLGGPLVRPLTRASFEPLHTGGFLTPRVAMEVAESGDVMKLDALETQFAETGVRMSRVDAHGVRRRVPRATDVLVAGLVEEDGADIDVAGVHASYLARFRRGGGQLLTSSRIASIERQGAGWRIGDGQRTIEAGIVVNAAGAWADPVAKLAGVRPLSIQPRRRTVVQVRVDTADVPADLPLVMDIAGRYYFRPQGLDRLWLCPHDETPVDAHDVAPEEIDVATAIHHFERVTSWRVQAVERRWAGLRSFAPDRLPVYGFDARAPGFFWCAGQGGVGIQTSPAASALCARLVLGRRPEIDAAAFAPARFD